MNVLTIETRGPGLIEFTHEVRRFAEGHDGLCHLFVQHTSCSLLIQENADPDVRRDLHSFFRRFAPHVGQPGTEYITHRTEGPDDMPAHIKAAVLPVSLSIPVEDGALMLGTWQGIYLFEHRDKPHRRHVIMTLA